MTIAWRINAERLTLFGWSRAILLQLAHPLIAAGVADHSTFRAGPIATAARLHHTIHAMLSLTFGTPTERERTLEKIRTIHRAVHGMLRERVGGFEAGTPYSAEQPELLLWVHATLLDSLPRIYEQLAGPMTMRERDQYCEDAEWVLRALGATAIAAPRSWNALQAYIAEMFESERIVVGTTARTLAAAVLSPPFKWVVAPASRANLLFTVGSLPERLRNQYGFEWTPREARALERWARTIRAARQWTPRALAVWPEARRIERT